MNLDRKRLTASTGKAQYKAKRLKKIIKAHLFLHCTPYKFGRNVTDGKKRPPDVKTSERLDDHELIIMRQVQEQLGRQLRLAENGDKRALDLLVNTARRSTQFLELLAWKNPCLLHAYSTTALTWPAFISNNKYINKNSRRLNQRLKLASKCSMKGSWNPYSKSTLEAITMLDWLLQNTDILQLPALSNKTWDKWFEVGWERILWETNNQPENNQQLRTIGARQGHTKTDSAFLTKSARTLKSNIRDRLKAALRASFKSLTKNFKEPLFFPDTAGI